MIRAGLCVSLQRKSSLASGSSCHLRFASCSVMKALFAHEEQIKPAAGLARFPQSEIERAAGAADRAKNRFVADVPAIPVRGRRQRLTGIARELGSALLSSRAVPARARAGSSPTARIVTAK